VFDFIALRDALQQIVNALDHRVLLPMKHSEISVEVNDTEVTATFEERRWVFPREDCVLLPIENTTAELMARWIGEQLQEIICKTPKCQIKTIRIEVEENFGQWAICEMAM
jgi:6-pyruvoyltetrahydropterin/6-carboxytetrahydropterin synthase